MDKNPRRILSQRELQQLHGQDYAARFEQTHGRRRLLQLIPLMKLDRNDDVADFGCGNGLLAAEVHQLVRTYTGVDFSEPFVELAVARATRLGATNVRFELSTIEDFCRRNPERFDAAFALDFSEHVYDDMWLKIAQSIRHTLKRGGTFYVHTPNANFILERIKTQRFMLRHSPEHVAVRSMADNVRLLESAGFKVSSKQYVSHYNVLRFLHALTPLPYVGRFFQARIFMAAVRPN
jgi:2-polyprenyl-3-methyl-5-hydroxy-6-metoxy-1,4-benzoquinol methylase